MEQIAKPLKHMSNSIKVSYEFAQDGKSIQELMEDVFTIILKKESNES